MSCAIIRLSWKSSSPERCSMRWEVCGTAFFVDPCLALTAYHVLSSRKMKPHRGYQHCQYWLASTSAAPVPLVAKMLDGFPDKDVTLIRFTNPQKEPCYQLAKSGKVSQKVMVTGCCKAIPLAVDDFSCRNHVWTLNSCALDKTLLNRSGIVTSLSKESITAPLVNIKNCPCLITNLEGIEGFSGAPLLVEGTKQVLGVISFGKSSLIYPQGVLCAIDLCGLESMLLH